MSINNHDNVPSYPVPEGTCPNCYSPKERCGLISTLDNQAQLGGVSKPQGDPRKDGFGPYWPESKWQELVKRSIKSAAHPPCLLGQQAVTDHATQLTQGKTRRNEFF